MALLRGLREVPPRTVRKEYRLRALERSGLFSAVEGGGKKKKRGMGRSSSRKKKPQPRKELWKKHLSLHLASKEEKSNGHIFAEEFSEKGRLRATEGRCASYQRLRKKRGQAPSKGRKGKKKPEGRGEGKRVLPFEQGGVPLLEKKKKEEKERLYLVGSGQKPNFYRLRKMQLLKEFAFTKTTSSYWGKGIRRSL